jgi:hypothetical protein
MGAVINWAIDVCFNLIYVKENERGPMEPMIVQRWQRPGLNTLKVRSNVDGAYIAGEETGAAGGSGDKLLTNFLMAISRRLPLAGSSISPSSRSRSNARV